MVGVGGPGPAGTPVAETRGAPEVERVGCRRATMPGRR